LASPPSSSGQLFPLAALRAVSAKRAARRRGAALGEGYPLDASAPSTAELVDAYDELLQATRIGGPFPVEPARDAGHLALVEVAVLLQGRAPQVPEQTSFVAYRTRAIRDLSADLLRAHRGWLERRSADARSRPPRGATAERGVTDGRPWLHGDRSVGQLEWVSQLLRRGFDDAPYAVTLRMGELEERTRPVGHRQGLPVRPLGDPRAAGGRP
jgi:hypothetical protein